MAREQKTEYSVEDKLTVAGRELTISGKAGNVLQKKGDVLKEEEVRKIVDVLQEEEARKIVKELEKNDIIKLTISYCGITLGALEIIANALKVNGKLTHLAMEYSVTTDEQAEHIAKILKENKKITYLSLAHMSRSRRKIGVKGLYHIGKALEGNSTLTHLDLSGHEFDDAYYGCLLSHITKPLQKNTTLTYLNLALCSINFSGAMDIGELLQENKALTTLDIGMNDLAYKIMRGGRSWDMRGVEQIANALEKNTTLTHLSLKKNLMGNDGWMAIAKALEKNYTLTKLDFSNSQELREIFNLDFISDSQESQGILRKLIKRNQNLSNRITGKDGAFILVSPYYVHVHRTKKKAEVVGGVHSPGVLLESKEEKIARPEEVRLFAQGKLPLVMLFYIGTFLAGDNFNPKYKQRTPAPHALLTLEGEEEEEVKHTVQEETKEAMEAKALTEALQEGLHRKRDLSCLLPSMPKSEIEGVLKPALAALSHEGQAALVVYFIQRHQGHHTVRMLLSAGISSNLQHQGKSLLYHALESDSSLLRQHKKDGHFRNDNINAVLREDTDPRGCFVRAILRHNVEAFYTLLDHYNAMQKGENKEAENKEENKEIENKEEENYSPIQSFNDLLKQAMLLDGIKILEREEYDDLLLLKERSRKPFDEEASLWPLTENKYDQERVYERGRQIEYKRPPSPQVEVDEWPRVQRPPSPQYVRPPSPDIDNLSLENKEEKENKGPRLGNLDAGNPVGTRSGRYGGSDFWRALVESETARGQGFRPHFTLGSGGAGASAQERQEDKTEAMPTRIHPLRRGGGAISRSSQSEQPHHLAEDKYSQERTYDKVPPPDFHMRVGEAAVSAQEGKGLEDKTGAMPTRIHPVRWGGAPIARSSQNQQPDPQSFQQRLEMEDEGPAQGQPPKKGCCVIL